MVWTDGWMDMHVDMFDIIMERYNPEDRGYREMFSTSHKGEDVS